MSRKFELVAPNGEVDVHPDPPGLWARVVVAGLWQDAKITRRRWPHAACVGPLRTRAGIDLLIRNLLLNDQVRVVVIDGPTGGVVGEETRDALERLWHQGEGVLSLLGADLAPYAVLVRDNVKLLDTKHHRIEGSADGTRMSAMSIDPAKPYPVGWNLLPNEDRPGGAVRLPPPPPKASAPAPHGDPGERVAGDTLAEVWPLALATVMRFGREIPSTGGATREFLNLVSVIRDPIASLRLVDHIEINVALTSPSVLGLTWATVEKYTHEQLIGSVVPEGQSYGYGMRMAGAGRPETVREGIERAARGQLYRDDESTINQFAAVKKLLTEQPDTRCAYLTPWRVSEDCGKPSNTPCLVGVMFRAVPAETMDLCAICRVRVGEKGCADHGKERASYTRNALHMTVHFRSHDMASAYPLNLAGCCLWLSEWARDLGMSVGTLTCVSSSAHVYSRDWAKTESVIESARRPTIVWDQRSVWRVELYDTEEVIPQVCDRLLPPHHQERCAKPATAMWSGYDGKNTPLWSRCDEHPQTSDRTEKFPSVPLPLPRRKALRAIALAADGQGGVLDSTKPIAVIEAATPGGLRTAIERSGLVVGIGAGMWLGAEIERVWGMK